MKEKKVYKTSETHVSLANLQRFKTKNDETYAPKSHGHSNATTGTNGFMSNTDKAKLDGIAAGANNYVHPNDANTRHVTDAEKTSWNNKLNVKFSPVSSMGDGFSVGQILSSNSDGAPNSGSQGFYLHADTGSGYHGALAWGYGSNVLSVGYKGAADSNYSWNRIYHQGFKPSAADVGAVNKAGDTMSGVVKFAAATSPTDVTTPTQLGYGCLSSYGPLRLLANTDNSSTDEPVIIASAKGLTTSQNDGLVVGPNYLRFLGNDIYHAGNKPTKADMGLGSVNNWGASSAIGANSTTEYATTNMVAQVRTEKANVTGTLTHKGNVNLDTLVGTAIAGFNNGEVGRPADWGGVLQWANINNPTPGTNSHWLSQLAFSTNDRLYHRTRTNTGGWTGWGAFYSTKHKPTAGEIGAMADGGTYGTIKLSNWIRTTGSSGWHSESYGGGWHMTDGTYIRSYGSKQMYINNQILCTSNVVAYYSDERLKKNFKKVDNALSMVMSVNPYYYEQNDFAKELGYNEEGEIQLGFKAQEIEKILPQVVKEAAINQDNGLSDEVREKIGDNPIKTIDYGKLTPLLWKAIQELTLKVGKLELELKNIKLEVVK